MREIERNNLIHLHLLIRTIMDDPADILGKIMQKASGTTSELAHCENIRSVAAITRYTVKNMADMEVVQFLSAVFVTFCEPRPRRGRGRKTSVQRDFRGRAGRTTSHALAPSLTSA